MSFVVNTKTYNEDAQLSPNAVRYAGPNQTFAATDLFDLKRTPPKTTAVSAGVARSSIKLSRSELVNTVKQTVIGELNMSAPVGVASATVQGVLTDLCDLGKSATGTAVVISHDLKH